MTAGILRKKIIQFYHDGKTYKEHCRLETGDPDSEMEAREDKLQQQLKELDPYLEQ